MILNYFIEDEEIRFGKFLASTWRVYWQNFFAITCISLLPALVLALAAAILVELANFLPVAIVLSLFFTIAFVITIIVATSAIIIYTEGAATGGSPSVGAALAGAWSRLPAAITTGLLTIVFLIGWSLLLVIPGIIKSVRHSYVLHAVALRGVNNMEAIRCSHKVVKDYWWIVAFSGIALAVPRFVVLLAVAAATLQSYDEVAKLPLASVINFLEGSFWVVGETLMFLALERIKNATGDA